MTTRRTALGLPLLAKELIELAARRRTYVVRTVYAALLFGFSILIFWGEVYSRSANPLDLLGQGKQMFFVLFMLEIVGVMLFTPALTCAAITTEKERNTFGLLLLTKLGPWTILLEKYLGRVVSMTVFLLVSLPLFGFCYALGGIDQVGVWAAFLSLFTLMLQLAALGVFCSSLFRTTIGAFVASYLIGFLVLFGPILADEMFRVPFVRETCYEIWQWLNAGVAIVGQIGFYVTSGILNLFNVPGAAIFPSEPGWKLTAWSRSSDDSCFLFFSPFYIVGALNGSFRTIVPWRLFVVNIPSLCLTAFWLILARLVIIRRAFAFPKNYLMKLFRSMDGVFEKLNHNRLTRGIVLVDSQSRLPGNAPVAWRETTKTTLGTFQYLLRLFVAIEFPVIALCLLVLTTDAVSSFRNRHEAMTVMVLIMWLLSVLLVCVKGATLIAGERSHETLDVLLSTPIRSDDLVKQKIRGVRRLILALSIPLMTIIGTHAWCISLRSGGFFSNALRDPDRSAVLYFVVQASTVVIFLPLIAWISFLIGLWMKTSTRAIFAALACIAGWIILPFPVIIAFFEAFNVQPGDAAALVLMFSPAAVPAFTEVGELDDLARFGSSESTWLPVLLQLVIYVPLLLMIRGYCLANAGRLLGRAENGR